MSIESKQAGKDKNYHYVRVGDHVRLPDTSIKRVASLYMDTDAPDDVIAVFDDTSEANTTSVEKLKINTYGGLQ